MTNYRAVREADGSWCVKWQDNVLVSSMTEACAKALADHLNWRY